MRNSIDASQRKKMFESRKEDKMKKIIADATVNLTFKPQITKMAQ